MPTLIRLTLTIRNGLFNTISTELLGANRLNTTMKSVLKLIQNDSPLITRAIMTNLLRRTTLTRTRNTKKAELEIDEDFRAATAGTIDALTNLIGADAIAGLSADDRRHQPLMSINRALARQDLCLDVEIDHMQLPRIDRLVMAPQARVDIAWNGDTIMRVTNWNTEIIMVEGRGDRHDRIKIDMHQNPHRFNELMRQQAPFIRVNGGHGRINSSGLRILRHGSLDGLVHNNLPEALQLHFAGGDSAVPT